MHIYTLSTHIHLQTSPSFVAGTATGGADRIPSTSGRRLQGDSTTMGRATSVKGAPFDGVTLMGIGYDRLV